MECSVLKMECVPFIVCIQGHSKNSVISCFVRKKHLRCIFMVLHGFKPMEMDIHHSSALQILCYSTFLHIICRYFTGTHNWFGHITVKNNFWKCVLSFSTHFYIKLFFFFLFFCWLLNMYKWYRSYTG